MTTERNRIHTTLYRAVLATLESRFCSAWDRSLRAIASPKTAGSSRLCSVMALAHGRATAASDRNEAPRMITAARLPIVMEIVRV